MDKKSRLKRLYNEMKLACAEKSPPSTLLPNPWFEENEGGTDFCLIAMEPSAGRTLVESITQEERDRSRNFLASVEDMILHYCSFHFLCNDSFRYHVTDVRKCVMKVRDARKDQTEKWSEWIPFLEKELEIVNPKSIVILGRGLRDHICKNDMLSGHRKYSVTHYSAKHTQWIKQDYHDLNLSPSGTSETDLSNFILTQLLEKKDLKKVETKKIERFRENAKQITFNDHHQRLLAVYEHRFKEFNQKSAE